MRARPNKPDGAGINYWQSYSDMMSALLLLFILLLLALAYKNEQMMLKKEEEINEIYQEMYLEKQEVYLESSEKIDSVINIKTSIITQLISELDQDDLEITIDEQTGIVSFDTNLLFDTNSYELKEQGKVAISRFISLYLDILFRDNNIRYIEEITVLGHTDTAGGYGYNLKLSQMRALSVVEYLVVQNGAGLSEELIEKLKFYIGADGKSFSHPVYNDDGTVNMDASRRVEFRFTINESEVTSIIEGVLDDMDGGNNE